MVNIVKSIVAPLPGWSDIWMALIASILTVLSAAIIGMFVPTVGFLEIFQSIYVFFFTIITLASVYGFISGEIFINMFIGPLLEWIFNLLIGLANVIPQYVFGASLFRAYRFTPIDLSQWAYIFLNMLYQITGLGGVSVDQSLLGGGLVGAGSSLLGSGGSGGSSDNQSSVT